MWEYAQEIKQVYKAGVDKCPEKEHRPDRTDGEMRVWLFFRNAFGSPGFVGRRQWIYVQFAEEFAVLCCIGGDVTGEVGGENVGVIVAEGDSKREIVCSSDTANFAAVGVPEDEVVIASASDELPVVAVANAEHARAVCVPAFELLAFLHFPKFDCAILAARSQQLGILAPAQGGDGSLMASKEIGRAHV